jgi:hypothetical protein
MATALGQQLQQLAARVGKQNSRPKGKPSLLYTFQEAADIDVQTIYEIGMEGALGAPTKLYPIICGI